MGTIDDEQFIEDPQMEEVEVIVVIAVFPLYYLRVIDQFRYYVTPTSCSNI